MSSEQLDEGNFVLYAARTYINDQCFDTSEFFEDLNRFKYLKRLLNRYDDCADLKERLIINHLVVLYNVFDYDAVTRMIFFKLREHVTKVKPFLLLMGKMPEIVDHIEGGPIYSSDITMDENIVSILRAIV